MLKIWIYLGYIVRLIRSILIDLMTKFYTKLVQCLNLHRHRLFLLYSGQLYSSKAYAAIHPRNFPRTWHYHGLLGFCLSSFSRTFYWRYSPSTPLLEKLYSSQLLSSISLRENRGVSLSDERRPVSSHTENLECLQESTTNHRCHSFCWGEISSLLLHLFCKALTDHFLFTEVLPALQA